MALSERQISEYLHRSYTAVDGLWFMKLEERFGFDTALALDQAVWGVLPKIQARKLKELTGRRQGLEDLRYCFGLKLELDGFRFTIEALDQGDGFRVITERCPWHEKMIAAGRTDLSGNVGDCICPTEYGVWAEEFGPGIVFGLGERLCDGHRRCILTFESASRAG